MMNRYPSYMVPFVGLNPEIKVDDLLEHYDFAIARRVDRSLNNRDIIIKPDGTGIVRTDSSLRADYFERVPNLSLTMLRLNHSLSSAQYSLLMKPTIDDWKGGIVVPWRLRGKASMNKESFLMVYCASNIHNQPTKYKKKFQSLSEAQVAQDKYEGLKNDIIAKAFSKDQFYKAYGQIFLRHSPTLLNYWHYELKLVDSEGNTINSVKYKKDETYDMMNMRPSFVSYVLDNYLFKFFWVNKNPCSEDIPYTKFFNKTTSPLIRWLADILNRCFFSLFPIVSE